MQVNTITPNSLSKLNFSARISGKVALDISKEIFANNSAKYSQAYVDHFEKIKASGSNDSEIYLSKGVDGMMNFVLKNPRISTAYEKPLVKTKPGHLLEGFFKIKSDDIQKAENEISSMITTKRDAVFEMSKTNEAIKQKIIEKGGSSDFNEAFSLLKDDDVIDMYYASKMDQHK